MMKTFRYKSISILVLVFVLIAISSGCMNTKNNKFSIDNKLKIVSTIFPSYDFARETAGDLADIYMLLKPGTENHSYEPSPEDIIKIKNCDLFIYTGGESDVWVDEMLEAIDNPDIKIIKMIECVNALEEETIEGMQINHTHTLADNDEHKEEYDEHVWTSPLNAIAITQKIAQVMAEIDVKNQSVYYTNAQNYIKKLNDLNSEFKNIVSNSSKKLLVFGDRFPFRYFADEYGLEYRAAFPGCSAEAEPSVKTIAYLIDVVKKHNIKYIFYIEFSNKKIAGAIEDETGAKPLLFHSCHNVTADEMKNNVTYLELMQKNASTLKEALE